MQSEHSCLSVDELAEFSANKLSSEASSRVTEHLRNCPHCRESLASLCGRVSRAAVAGTEPGAPAQDSSIPSGECKGPGMDTGMSSEPITVGWPRTEIPAQPGSYRAAQPVPEQLREYQLLNQLGKGGMGTVYRAIHTSLGKLVALKVLSAQFTSDPAAVARFRREMRAAGQLSHPNIVQATDAGEVDGLHFLVMEFIEGSDLAALVRKRGPLPIADACEVVRQAALGLEHAHAHGLVHRDVKPSNLLLARDGQVKVLDLGLALLQEAQPGSEAATVSGLIMGTLDYVAPEQIDDPHRVDARADLYSLGCTLYHLLAGRPPFSGPSFSTTGQKLKAHAFAAPPPIRQSRPEVPAGLASILERLLAKEPAERLASAADVATALAPFAAGSNLAVLAEGGPRVPHDINELPTVQALPGGKQSPRRRSWFAGAAAVTALLAILAGVVIHVQTDRGVLEIETVDDDVKVVVEKSGDIVTILDLKTRKEFTLRSGKYQLKLADGSNGLELDVADVTVKRDDKAIAHVRRKKAGQAALNTSQVVRPAPAEPGELRRFEGHTGQINCFALTPDGKLAASGSNDSTVRIWDVASGKMLRRCQGVTEEVWGMAVTPDGRSVLSGGGGFYRDGRWQEGADFSLHLLDLASGKEQRRLEGHTRAVRCVAISRDAKNAVSGGLDRTVRVWDLQTGKERFCLEGHAGTVTSVALSPDGRHALSAGWDKTIRLWDIETGKELRRFTGPGHTEVISCIRFSPDGRLALSGSLDRTMRLWNVATGEEIRVFPRHPTGLLCVAFSPDGRRVLSGTGSVMRGVDYFRPAGYDYTLRLWDLATGRELHQFEGHGNGVMACAFLPDGYHAVTASTDRTLRLWRLPEPLPTAPFPANEAGDLQQRWAAITHQPVTVANSIGMKQVLVPPGEFELAPGHRVQVTRPFRVGAHEVTVGQFHKFVEETGYRTEAELKGTGGIILIDGKPERKPGHTWKHAVVSRGDDYPVALVSWTDAVRFCDWLTRKEKKIYRLPTAAEWQWAARAGAAGPYPSGSQSDLDASGWHNGNAGGQSRPVGQKKPNAWGLYDTWGNVAEFCRDWRGEYPKGTCVADPVGPTKGQRRVVSGGSFLTDAKSVQGAHGQSPGQSRSEVGFRVVCELPQPEILSPRYAVLIDAGTKTYQAWLKRMRHEGLRPVRISACAMGGVPRFAAIALRDSHPVPWEAKHDLDEPSYRQAWAKMRGEGYRMQSTCGYLDGDRTRFSSLWLRDGDVYTWSSNHDIAPADLTGYITAKQGFGMRAEQVEGYSSGDKTLFVALCPSAHTTPSVFRSELTAQQVNSFVEAARRHSYRPINLSAYPAGRETRFTLTLAQDNTELRWQMRHGLNHNAFRQEHDHWTSRGYRPLLISSYEEAGQGRYLAAWVADRHADPPLPRSGKVVAELEGFDQAMDRFMRERGIRAGALAVIKDGKLVLSRGYGYADREDKREVVPETPFRLASVTKPITAAAILKLIRSGKLKRDDRVYDLLHPEPPPGERIDPRWKEVTIGQLLEHKGGWDRSAAFDPMFRPVEAALALGKPSPASAADIIRYMAGQPMQFAPGSKSAYSNFGYCLLGRVIEKASGMGYLEYLQKEVLAPAGATGIYLGRTLPKDRDRREPVYDDPDVGPNAMESGRNDWVPAPDGTFCLEAMDSHGGLTASAVDVARFLSAYTLSGEPAGARPVAGSSFGSMPGTFTMALQRADGVGVVALFNRRKDRSGRDYFAIRELMDRAADGVVRWPDGEKAEKKER
jgi:serine/threonine protein kinase/WD40 repeat protein/CubicO group peptidase (beta-lactamase class C family)